MLYRDAMLYLQKKSVRKGYARLSLIFSCTVQCICISCNSVIVVFVLFVCDYVIM